MMRSVETGLIGQAVKELCLKNAFSLPEQIRRDIEKAIRTESSPTARRILAQMLENADLAAQLKLPLCQDTGLVKVVADLGREVRLTGPDSLETAVNQGVAEAYREGYLRKSTCHPLTRRNLGDNTPASLELNLSEGSALRLSVFSKGGGCDNQSRLFMLKPTEGWEGLRRAVMTAVREAGPGACPPLYIGVGLGGSFETVPALAGAALRANLSPPNEDEDDQLAARLLAEVQTLGFGPMGLGGDHSALGLRLKSRPGHIASLPVAVNLNCHSFRLSSTVL